MIYNTLAKYYDGLVKDDEATKAWVDLIHPHMRGNNLLELACGSGEITIALANKGYCIDASDLSTAMIEEAKKKPGADKVHFFVMDMCEFTVDKKYDGILCLCDSINYLLKEEQLNALFKNVYEHLIENGTFIFDMHTPDRLYEFEEEFYEQGIVEGHEYTWSIQSEEDCLYHNFMFYDQDANYSLEQHIQKVFTTEYMDTLLTPYFTYEIYTDFTQKGVCEGEKYFYVCRKKG